MVNVTVHARKTNRIGNPVIGGVHRGRIGKNNSMSDLLSQQYLSQQIFQRIHRNYFWHMNAGDRQIPAAVGPSAPYARLDPYVLSSDYQRGNIWFAQQQYRNFRRNPAYATNNCKNQNTNVNAGTLMMGQDTYYPPYHTEGHPHGSGSVSLAESNAAAQMADLSNAAAKLSQLNTLNPVPPSAKVGAMNDINTKKKTSLFGSLTLDAKNTPVVCVARSIVQETLEGKPKYFGVKKVKQSRKGFYIRIKDRRHYIVLTIRGLWDWRDTPGENPPQLNARTKTTFMGMDVQTSGKGFHIALKGKKIEVVPQGSGWRLLNEPGGVIHSVLKAGSDSEGERSPDEGKLG